MWGVRVLAVADQSDPAQGLWAELPNQLVATSAVTRNTSNSTISSHDVYKSTACAKAVETKPSIFSPFLLATVYKVIVRRWNNSATSRWTIIINSTLAYPGLWSVDLKALWEAILAKGAKQNPSKLMEKVHWIKCAEDQDCESFLMTVHRKSRRIEKFSILHRWKKK